VFIRSKAGACEHPSQSQKLKERLHLRIYYLYNEILYVLKPEQNENAKCIIDGFGFGDIYLNERPK